MTDGQFQDARIVVGVDGSPGSKAALHWAMVQATLTGAAIEAVAAWQDATAHGHVAGWPPDAGTGYNSAAAATRKALDETVAEVARGLPQPVDVFARVSRGPAATMLLESASDAAMLVIGARRNCRPDGRVPLGEVAQQCVDEAICPVVVVRGYPSTSHGTTEDAP